MRLFTITMVALAAAGLYSGCGSESSAEGPDAAAAETPDLGVWTVEAEQATGQTGQALMVPIARAESGSEQSISAASAGCSYIDWCDEPGYWGTV